jgi:glycosyltransferase involved in cell wall biosynthesis
MAEAGIRQRCEGTDGSYLSSEEASLQAPERTTTVLHIAESYSSGVASSIDAYLDAQPDGVKAAVYGYRIPGVQLGDRVDLDVPFHELPAGKWAQLRAVRRIVGECRPDVVHLHSSWAGLFGRIVPMPRHTRVVFTPHGFGFQRLDLPRFMRLGFLLADKVLGVRTDVVLACSVHEATLSRRHRLARSVLHLPQELPLHVSAALCQAKRAPRAADGPIIVGMTGRICPQKGSDFFAAVARALRATAAGREGFVLRWIGGGPEGSAAELEAAGVEVTGWLPQDISVKELASCDVYLHSAAWEGYPMTIIEARQLGMPVIGRLIPALAAESEGIQLAADPAEAATALGRLAANWPVQHLPFQPTSVESRRRIMAEAYGLS